MANDGGDGLRTALSEMLATAGAVEGIKRVVQDAPDSLVSEWPLLVGYVSTGTATRETTANAAGNMVLGFADSVVLEVHGPHADLASNVRMMAPFRSRIIAALFRRYHTDKFGGTVFRLKEIRYRYGALEWGPDEHNIGYRFTCDIETREEIGPNENV